MLQSKINKAFNAILEQYADVDCIGDVLDTIDPSDFGLSIEESFIVYMKLKAHCDGDRYFRQYNGYDFIEEFDYEDDEWFTIVHEINVPVKELGYKE